MQKMFHFSLPFLHQTWNYYAQGIFHEKQMKKLEKWKKFCFNNRDYHYQKKGVDAWFEIASVSLVKKRVCRHIPQSWPNHFLDLAKSLKNASLASKHFFLVPFFLPQKLWKNLKSDIWNFFLRLGKHNYYNKMLFFCCYLYFFCFHAFEKA